MVEAIRDFFERYLKAGADASASGPKVEPLHLATAAVLIEMTRMDGTSTATERERVTRVVKAHFALDDAQVAALLRLAEDEAKRATDYYQFTSLIKEYFSAEQRERLVQYLWEVAYADGALNAYEEHLVRKIADLLYVPHQAFIAAKLRAKTAASRTP